MRLDGDGRVRLPGGQGVVGSNPAVPTYLCWSEHCGGRSRGLGLVGGEPWGSHGPGWTRVDGGGRPCTLVRAGPRRVWTWLDRSGPAGTSRPLDAAPARRCPATTIRQRRWACSGVRTRAASAVQGRPSVAPGTPDSRPEQKRAFYPALAAASFAAKWDTTPHGRVGGEPPRLVALWRDGPGVDSASSGDLGCRARRDAGVRSRALEHARRHPGRRGSAVGSWW
jgi:hypothetical protein